MDTGFTIKAMQRILKSIPNKHTAKYAECKRTYSSLCFILNYKWANHEGFDIFRWEVERYALSFFYESTFWQEQKDMVECVRQWMESQINKQSKEV